MTMVKNLDKRLLKKDSRFTLLEDYGDGSRTFGYRTLELSTYRTGGMTHLHIYFDHDKYDFTTDEWFETAGHELQGLFNGVECFDVERLVTVCDKIITEIERLQSQVMAEPDVDMTSVVEALENEYKVLYPLVEDAKKIKWWMFDSGASHRWSNDLTNASDAVNEGIAKLGKISETLDQIKHGVEPELTRTEKKNLVDRLERYGYVVADVSPIDPDDKYDYRVYAKLHKTIKRNEEV